MLWHRLCVVFFFVSHLKNLTWLEVVGVTALLSGVLARANAVANSLCVIGRGPVAPLWLSDTGRIPAEPPTLLGGPAGLPCNKHLDMQTYAQALEHHWCTCTLYLKYQGEGLTDWKSSSSSDMPSNMKPPAGPK